MLSFLRRVLWGDDKLNTGQSNSEIHCDESPSQSYNYHVNVIPDYGTFSTTKPNIPSVYNHVKFDIDGQVDIPQKPNISPVYNQPKQIPPRNNPEKTPDIPTATHTNVFLKSNSSSSLPHPPSPNLDSSSSSPFGALSGSLKSPTVFTKPILARGASTLASNQTKSQYNIVEKGSTPLNVIPDDIKGLIREDKSEHLQQSTSKHNLKRTIKLVSDQKLKFDPLRKTLQKGNDCPQTSRKPPRTLPAKDVKVDIDGQSTGSFTITQASIKHCGQSTVRPTLELLSTQTATRTQSQNYSTSFNFPQKPNISPVYNQPKQIPPRINPEKTPDIPTATHTNVFLKSTTSSSLPHPPSPNLDSSFSSSSSSPFGALPGSLKSPTVCTKPILPPVEKYTNLVSDKSEHLQQSTSKRNLKRNIKLVRDQNLKIASLRKTLQKGNDHPQTSRKPTRTLPAKDVKVDIDGQSTGSSTITQASIKHCGQSRVPARRSLADYLRESGPRLVSLYGSRELYPTDEARCIIQGMVRAILNLKKGEREHNYLRHPENLILGDKECHPYSNYVRDLATERVIRNRKILEQAGRDFPTSTEVTLEKNRTDLKSDDLEALKCLIFDVILVLDDGKKPLLPAEWISFKELFSNTKLDYAVLSSHPCLWGYTKRLGFYIALAKWRYPSKSEKGVIDIVDDTLSSMKIFRTKWVEKIKRDSHLLKFADQMTRSRKRKVYELIRFFRNLVEHCPDEASPSSPYRKERYLDYKLRTIYPNLLEELHQRLLLAGFIY